MKYPFLEIKSVKFGGEHFKLSKNETIISIFVFGFAMFLFGAASSLNNADRSKTDQMLSVLEKDISFLINDCANKGE